MSALPVLSWMTSDRNKSLLNCGSQPCPKGGASCLLTVCVSQLHGSAMGTGTVLTTATSLAAVCAYGGRRLGQ